MNEDAFDEASRDLDLMRALLLHLTEQERSPPESIFVSLSALADLWLAGRDDVVRALQALSAHGFIEGPGLYEADSFLFRKITGNGRALAQAIGRPRDWKAIKARYLTSQRLRESAGRP
jgi:hypothetical protein